MAMFRHRNILPPSATGQAGGVSTRSLSDLSLAVDWHVLNYHPEIPLGQASFLAWSVPTVPKPQFGTKRITPGTRNVFRVEPETNFQKQRNQLRLRAGLSLLPEEFKKEERRRSSPLPLFERTAPVKTVLLVYCEIQYTERKSEYENATRLLRRLPGHDCSGRLGGRISRWNDRPWRNSHGRGVTGGREDVWGHPDRPMAPSAPKREFRDRVPRPARERSEAASRDRPTQESANNSK